MSNNASSNRKRSSLSDSVGNSRHLSSSLAFGGLTLSSLPQHRRASRERLNATQSLNVRAPEKALDQLKQPASSLAINDTTLADPSDLLQANQHVQNSPNAKAPWASQSRPSYSRQVSAPGAYTVTTPTPPALLKPAHSHRMLKEYIRKRQEYVFNHMHLMPQAPDGGWGWVVVFAAFATTAIVEGIAFSFAPILIHLTTEAPHQMLSILFMGATLMAVYLLMCPFAMALVNGFGCRRILSVGAIISTIGFLLSYYFYAFSSGAPPPPEIQAVYSNMSTTQLTTPVDYTLLIISYGGIAGIGFGLMYMASLVAVSQYFELNRTLAMGIALCGSGAGVLILPPSLAVVLDKYGFDAAAAALAALTANALVMARMIRPIKSEMHPKRHPRQKNILDRVREKQRDVAGVPYRAESEQSVSNEPNKMALEMFRRMRHHQLAFESGLNSMAHSRGELSITPSDFTDGMRSVPEATQTPFLNQEGQTLDTQSSFEPDATATPPLILVNEHDGIVDPSEANNVETEPTPLGALRMNTEDPGQPDPQDSITRLKDQLSQVLPPANIQAIAMGGGMPSRSDRSSSVASPKLSADDPRAQARTRQLMLHNRRFQVTSSKQPLIGPGRSSATPNGSRSNSGSVKRVVIPHGGSVSVADLARPLYKIDILYGRSISHLPSYKSENMVDARVHIPRPPPPRPHSSSLRSYAHDVESSRRDATASEPCFTFVLRGLLQIFPKPVVDPLRRLINPELFKDSAFLRMAFGSMLAMMAVPLPYLVLPWQALVLQTRRLDEEQTDPVLASTLISIIGGATMAGRLVSGFVADLPNMNILLLHNMALLVTTVATFMAHMALEFSAMCVYAGIFGFCFAFHMALAATVLGDTVGVERLTGAYGLVTIFRGLAPLCTIPLLTLLLGEPSYCVSAKGRGNPESCRPLPANSMPTAERQPDKHWWAIVPPPASEIESIASLSDPSNMTNGYRRVLWLSGALLFVASALFFSLHFSSDKSSSSNSHHRHRTRSKQNSQGGA